MQKVFKKLSNKIIFFRLFKNTEKSASKQRVCGQKNIKVNSITHIKKIKTKNIK